MSDGFIPYGRQIVDEDDIDAVVEVLRSDRLATAEAGLARSMTLPTQHGYRAAGFIRASVSGAR